jgi:uncharacterized protein YjbI with pentapeptide repeats
LFCWASWRAVLSEADLFGADLSGADLFETRLSRAILTGANLDSAEPEGRVDAGRQRTSLGHVSETVIGKPIRQIVARSVFMMDGPRSLQPQPGQRRPPRIVGRRAPVDLPPWPRW